MVALWTGIQEQLRNEVKNNAEKIHAIQTGKVISENNKDLLIIMAMDNDLQFTNEDFPKIVDMLGENIDWNYKDFANLVHPKKQNLNK